MSENIDRLWNKNFMLLIVGQIISLFGNTILRFAMPLYILEISGSPAIFGTISALSFLPMVIMSPVGGILADRVNKKNVMLILDFITAILITIYIAAISGQFSGVSSTVITMMALFAIQGMMTPTVQSSVPSIAPQSQLVRANAIVNLITSLSGMVAPVIGGILFASFGLLPILYVSVACFLLAVFLEIFIKIPHVKQPKNTGVFNIIKGDMSAGLRFIIKEKPLIAKSVAIIFIFNIVLSSMLLIGLPVIVTQNLGMESNMFGFTQAALMSGGLLGGALAGIFGNKLSIDKLPLMLLICSLSTIPMCLVLWIEPSDFISWLVITTMAPITMSSATLFTVLIFTFVQSQTPLEILGKVMSFIMAISLAAQPLGQFVFGMLFEGFYETPWIVVGLSSVASIAVSFYSRTVFKNI